MKVDTFAMVNLIAGERIVPELIQDAFTPEAVAGEAVSLLDRSATRRANPRRTRRRASQAWRAGRQPRAAEAILKIAERTCEPS